MKRIEKVFKYEDMSFDFIEEQLKGLIMELKKDIKHQEYIDEKCDNIIRHFKGTMENFKDRMNNEYCQKEFLKVVENEEV
jgi:hypothetical protein